MTADPEYVRILSFRYADSMSAARLMRLAQDTTGQRRDLVLDYDELRLSEPGHLSNENGHIYEHVRGDYLPRRIRFMGVSELECSGLYAHLDDVPLKHGARSLRGTLCWGLPGKLSKWAVFNGSEEPAELMLSAQRYQQEVRHGPVEPVDLVRDWAPAPHMVARTVSLHKRVHDLYGGDPVTVRVNGEAKTRHLFVGGQDTQSDHRPRVDAVLNLGDEASRWSAGEPTNSNDRWTRKGEGQNGMSVAEIQAEAEWVIERVRAGQRVLVHCSAGFNRSVTICCAAVMALDKVSTEAALSLVRQHHPWAKPDTHHWLALRWLSEKEPRHD